jgi:sugar phosphate isomerase/epimerase
MGFDRRTFLASMGALGACATMNGGPLAGHAIGIQLYALGPRAYDDLDATFAALAEIGYRKVEISEGRIPAPQVRAALARAGLTCCSIHTAMSLAPGGDVNEAAAKSAEYAHAVGATYAGPSLFPFVRTPPALQPGAGGRELIASVTSAYTRDDWLRACALMNAAAAHLQNAGIQYFYHNHNVEFAPFEAGTIMDFLIANTDPALVKLQVDVGWVAAAGVEVPAFIRRHAARVRLMHVKDLKPTQPNFALSMEPTEVGAGIMDWPAVLRAGRDAGVEHFLVEQEPPFSRPEMESARLSFRYLRTLV